MGETTRHAIFTVAWSDKDVAWVATVDIRPSLSWIAHDPGEALDGLLTAMIVSS